MDKNTRLSAEHYKKISSLATKTKRSIKAMIEIAIDDLYEKTQKRETGLKIIKDTFLSEEV